jgi:threonine dehydrogenase-like Zn-dependent dehydrogenase
MVAAQILAPEHCTTVSIPCPIPSRKQVRVKVEGCGLCASSLPLWEGRPWFSYPLPAGAPGHEGWGIVDAVGPGVSSVSAGTPVAFLSTNAFAQYDVAWEAEVVTLPAQLSSQPFPGEAVGCAFNIFRRADIRPGHTTAIVGIGFLGALLTQLASRAGSRVIAISRSASALNVAKESGAVIAFALDDDAVRQVMQLTEGKGCDRVIEAVGLQQTLDLASDLTGEGGRLIIAGYHQDGERTVNLQQWNWRGIDVINAHERDSNIRVAGLRHGIEGAVNGDIAYRRLLTHRFSIARLNEAFQTLRERPRGLIKVIIEP